MADIRINYNSTVKEGDSNHKIIKSFENTANEILLEVEGVFLFEYIEKHHQFDVLECPNKSYKYLKKIDSTIPFFFIASIETYKSY